MSEVDATEERHVKSIEQLTSELNALVTELDGICAHVDARRLGVSVNDRLTHWRSRTMEWLGGNLGDHFVSEFRDKRTGPWGNPDGTVEDRHSIWRSYLLSLQLDVSKHPDAYISKHVAAIRPKRATVSDAPAIQVLEQLLIRFHSSVVQLRHRHADRATLDVKDEYDVQDLLHVMLRTRFDDIRAEEVSPSYAGAGSRIDFLLKASKIALEVKMPNARLKDRVIGEQVLVDIARYKHHADCRTLVCFVYDPQHYLVNPAGLVADLTKHHDGLKVVVIVAPAA